MANTQHLALLKKGTHIIRCLHNLLILRNLSVLKKRSRTSPSPIVDIDKEHQLVLGVLACAQAHISILDEENDKMATRGGNCICGPRCLREFRLGA